MNRELKILISFVVLMLITLPSVMAQRESRDSLVLMSTLYYKLNQTYPDAMQREKLDELVVLMCCDTTMRLRVYSHTDLTGSDEINEHVSQNRATNVVDYMSNRIFSSGKVSRTRFEIFSKQQDYRATRDSIARRVEIYRYAKVYIDRDKIERDIEVEALEHNLAERVGQVDRRVEQKIEAGESVAEQTTMAQIEQQTHAKEIAARSTAVESDAVSSSGASSSNNDSDEGDIKHFTLRTNLLYICGGLINGGIEWRPGKGRVGYLINGGYAPFASQEWEHNWGGYFVSPEVRVYMGERMRGYLGVQALMGGYNIKVSDLGYQGDVYGAGLVGGYRTPISSTLELDFTLGVGYTQFDYGTYKLIYNGMSLYQSYGVEKRAWMPLQVGVSLIWGRN